MKKELRIYRTKDGKEPFIKWIESLKDSIGRNIIANRLNHLSLGHYGDHKFIGDGIYEIRIHYGPGYRLYFSEQENTIVLLLLGGNKRSQNSDINKAKKMWTEFKERIYD